MTDQALSPNANPAEPASAAPRARRRNRDVGVVGRVWGLVLVAVGLWLFATITLHIDLPDVPVRDLWPLAIIVVGALMLFGSRRGGK